MRDWERFLSEVSWFLDPGETAAVGPARPWSRGGIDGLPELSALLATATLTPVSAGGRDYELLAWGPATDRRGWLGEPPADAGDVAVHPLHRSLWTVSGGIVERFGEPASRWLNQDEVLTPTAARIDVGAVLDDYAWLWSDAGLDVPIQAGDHYVVAVEANGNLTLARRDDGRVLLFAPDHAFTGVTPLPGCPPYSLLTIDAAPDLASWIEECARAWRGHLQT